jgi:hypothetical protein
MINSDANELIGNVVNNDAIAARILGYAIADNGLDYDDAKVEIKSISFDGTVVRVHIIDDEFTDEFRTSIISACALEQIVGDSLIFVDEDGSENAAEKPTEDDGE